MVLGLNRGSYGVVVLVVKRPVPGWDGVVDWDGGDKCLVVKCPGRPGCQVSRDGDTWDGDT
jgi:hypothetical protein